jgi:hypothetical protein
MRSSRVALKRTIVAVAGLLGIAVGYIWIVYLIAASDSGQADRRMIVAMWITCPFMFTAALIWWLPPIFNGVYYGALAWLFLRPLRKRQAK